MKEGRRQLILYDRVEHWPLRPPSFRNVSEKESFGGQRPKQQQTQRRTIPAASGRDSPATRVQKRVVFLCSAQGWQVVRVSDENASTPTLSGFRLAHD